MKLSGNLTTLSFVNFQGKLTGTSWNPFACEASLFDLLCVRRRVLILRQQIVMQVVLLPFLVSCGGFKLGSRRFLVRSWAMRWARSSLKLVIGSIGFWQDPIDSLSYPVLLWVFTLCLNSCNILLPNLDWFGSALSCLVIFTLCAHILTQ
jgi:hypothetical protein